jgi:HD superfamily phosphodiesterase
MKQAVETKIPMAPPILERQNAVPLDREEKIGREIDPHYQYKKFLDQLMVNPNVNENTKLFHQLPLSFEDRKEMYEKLMKKFNEEKKNVE